MKLTLKIQENQLPQRIDKFVTKELGEFTRGEIVHAIKGGKILLNEKKIKASNIIKYGDEIKINISAKVNELKLNANIKLNIIFENEDFWVIDKQSGLQVHPSAINKDETLVNALVNLEPNLVTVGENWERPGIVHRLDKGTSGLMLVAKNNESFSIFKKMFQERLVQKTYLALVWGELDKSSDLIDLPIAKTTSHKKQKIAQGKFSGVARDAKTKYKVIKKFIFPYSNKIKNPSDQKNNQKLFQFQQNSSPNVGFLKAEKIKLSLLEAVPMTGRTHQIRIHLAHLGNPLVNDYRYYKKIHKQLNSEFLASEHSSFFLQANQLKFTFKNKSYNFKISLPNYFQAAMDKLEEGGKNF